MRDVPADMSKLDKVQAYVWELAELQTESQRLTYKIEEIQRALQQVLDKD